MTGREPGLWVIQVRQVPALEEVRVGLAETGNEEDSVCPLTWGKAMTFNIGLCQIHSFDSHKHLIRMYVQPHIVPVGP